MNIFYRLLVVSLCALQCVVSAGEVVLSTADVSASRLNESTYVLETYDKTTIYLLEGSERALLIDAGTRVRGLDSIAATLTDKPISIVLTHNHPDHAGEAKLFDTVYYHAADSVLDARCMADFCGQKVYVDDGYTFDLGGGRLVEVLHTPAHTPGSIVLLDTSNGDAYTGDAFGSGHVWLQCEPLSPMETYVASIDKMLAKMDSLGITRLYAGHYPYLKAPLGRDYLLRMRALACRIIADDTAESVFFDSEQPLRAPSRCIEQTATGDAFPATIGIVYPQ